MFRPLAAILAALLLVPAATRADEPKPQGQEGAASPETDPKVQAAIQKAVDKAKEELRNEMRAELQGAQSAAEFMGTVTQQPKTQLLELGGYFRVRGESLNKLNLRNTPDSAGYNYFPKPLRASSTITEANMRLRLEPTLNASETVRVRAQIDVLDNYVLGSNTNKVTNSVGSPYPVPFYGSTRTYTPGDKTNDRDPIIPRRVWGEVQTPVGLLSFGRMPNSWGLGILANDGRGLDQDYGDTVDRIQFAVMPVGTPIGQLIFIPIYDFDSTGPLFPDPHGGQGVGQPLVADRGSNARSLSLKIVHLDGEEEIRRLLERGEKSLNYGVYYSNRSQRYVYPAWLDQGFSGTYTQQVGSAETPWHRRSASAHVVSFWTRWLSPRLRVEAEVAGIYGEVGDANATANVDTNPPTVNSDRGPTRINMKQWGGVIQTEFKQTPKFSWGVELGAASGDGAPGFGNDPSRSVLVNGVATGVRPNYGSMDGPQWGRPGDRSINAFHFNPAYQVDLIFYRRIVGPITNAWYLRPNLHWDIIPGLALDTSVLYAQAQVAQATPSSASVDSTPDSPLDPSHKGKAPLALELDNKLSLSPTRSFTGWMDFGLMNPLAGMGSGVQLAWMVDFGFAARF